MKSADAISYMEARYPLSEEGRDAVGLARDLHRRLLDSNASEFPPDNSNLAWLIVVARDRGRAIGYASVITQSDDSELYIKWVLVDPEYRRQRVGTSLMLRVAVAALQAEKTLLVLQPWSEGDGDLERWFEAMGFELVEDQNAVPSRYMVARPPVVQKRIERMA